MKKLLVISVYIFGFVSSKAQTFTKAAFIETNDTIIARFNRGDYKGIYAMAGSLYKQQTREGGLISDLKDNKNFTGRILSSQMTADLGKVVHFTWTGEKAALNMELWMEGPQVVRFKFNNFVVQPGWPVHTILSDNNLTTSLDSIVQKYASVYMSSPKAAALSIGIYLNGKTYEYNYGEVEKGSGKLPDKQTIYTLGSVTKPLIGLLLARAVTENRLELSDDIRKYLPGSFPNLEYQGRPVTLKDLVTHTWGFSRFRINAFPANYETMTPAEQQVYYERYTKDSLYRDLHLVKLDTVPGVRYRYNIGGMLLVGLALEKVYGQPLDRIVYEYYGGKLHMNNTKLISDIADIAHFAKGYNEKGELMPSLAGMTASLYTMKTTTSDMLKFLTYNIEESKPDIKLAHTPLWGNPQSLSLGIFWQVTDDFGLGRWLKHTGYDYGSITMCSLHPDEKTGMMIWASDDSRQNNLFDLERNIMESIRALKK